VLAASAITTLGDFELDVELYVTRGETLALAGPSGAGKTTMLRTIAGLVTPQTGTVVCGGETWLDTNADTNEPPERRAVGYVFQDYALFPHLSAWRNVAYGLPKGGSREVRRRLAHAHLKRFGLEQRAEAKPHTLSGGERQRVALARALARDPKALLLDEPLSALDARTRASATRELAVTLATLDVPTVLVTHDFTEAAQLADEIAVIDNGKVVQRGTADELAAQPRSAFVADFAGAVVLYGTARRKDQLTLVELPDGTTIASTDDASGPVAATLFPWEITIGAETDDDTSAQNRLNARVTSVTTIGNRTRVGLESHGQHLAAEITTASADRLTIAKGDRVTATWKAAATRLIPR
jgi:molybdate transport system ATP-binding protein